MGDLSKESSSTPSSSEIFSAPESTVDIEALRKELHGASFCDRFDPSECLQYSLASLICLLPAFIIIYLYWPKETETPVYCSECAQYHNQWCRHAGSRECVCINEASPIILKGAQLHCVRMDFCDKETRSFIASVRSTCAKSTSLPRFLELVFEDTILEDVKDSYSAITAMLLRVAFEVPDPCKRLTVQACIETLQNERSVQDLADAQNPDLWWERSPGNDTRWSLFNCVVDEDPELRTCDNFSAVPKDQRAEHLEILYRYYLVSLLYSYGVFQSQTSFDGWKEPILAYIAKNGGQDELWLLATNAFMQSPKAESLSVSRNLIVTSISQQWDSPETFECEESYISLAEDILVQPVHGNVSYSFMETCKVDCGMGCTMLKMKSDVPGSRETHLPWWFLGACEVDNSPKCVQAMDFLTSDVRDLLEDCFDLTDTSVHPNFTCLFETVNDLCIVERDCDPKITMELALRVWTSYAKHRSCLDSATEAIISKECKPIKMTLKD